MVTDSENRILIAADVDGPGVDTGDFAVARYLPNGALDPSFAGDGILTLNLAGGTAGDHANAIALDSQGRVVVGGSSGEANTAQTAVVRLTAAGTPDPSFGGGDGIFLQDFDGANGDFVDDLAVDSAGPDRRHRPARRRDEERADPEADAAGRARPRLQRTRRLRLAQRQLRQQRRRIARCCNRFAWTHSDRGRYRHHAGRGELLRRALSDRRHPRHVVRDEPPDRGPLDHRRVRRRRPQPIRWRRGARDRGRRSTPVGGVRRDDGRGYGRAAADHGRDPGRGLRRRRGRLSGFRRHRVRQRDRGGRFRQARYRRARRHRARRVRGRAIPRQRQPRPLVQRRRQDQHRRRSSERLRPERGDRSRRPHRGGRRELRPCSATGRWRATRECLAARARSRL